MRFLPVNQNAILVEVESLEAVMALHQSLMTAPIAEILDIIPAARTLLIYFDRHRLDQAQLVHLIRQREHLPVLPAAGQLIVIPVVYDGEDLDDVAAWLEITTDEVIQRHTEHRYQVAFTGFAPGFAYLSCLDKPFNVSRRSSPRTRIPAGSVALAGEFSGIYPKDSPGGWQLIGSTSAVLWDLQRQPPALFQPGDQVQFEAVDQLAPKVFLTSAPPARLKESQHAAALEIITPGLLTTFQDQGRFGMAAMGISESGAMDQGAYRQANQIVGNDDDWACLEITQGGLAFNVYESIVVSFTGAMGNVTVLSEQGQTTIVSHYQPIALYPGDRCQIAMTDRGARGYLAVRGGFKCTPILNSSSYDSLAQVGPLPLQAGDCLELANRSVRRAVMLDQMALQSFSKAGEEIVLDITMGPHSDWFHSKSLDDLIDQVWQVTPQSNRIGLRLQGQQALSRKNNNELPSEGTTMGAIQVPANGQPVLFTRDHPLTGGYPVIASVASYHLDRAGQLPVGAWIRFNLIQPFREL
ncbi:5-oxoprolinase subunit PxpB [Celerinatantimonas sp. YJH-8]|uniref:5-oxoprolinase subunit PxpB n=1 Tax=Celerinatantimonas sp. YJH-8 TaxID=3228714 RepID=UPI0038C02FAB